MYQSVIINRAFKIFLFIFLHIIIIFPIVVFFIPYFSKFTSVLNFSFYGIIVVAYYILQTIFAMRNRKHMNSVHNKYAQQVHNEKVNLMVVGYREEPKLFKNCLLSIMNMKNIDKVFIVVDGNEEQDLYMVNIAQEVFSNSTYINFNTLLSKDKNIYIPELNMKYIIISQPHAGKRHALYTGYYLNSLTNSYALVATDSDTIIEPDCAKKMLDIMIEKDCMAVAGQVDIINKYDSLISFISYLRYWYAFNLERAAQSFNNFVMCISGPLGLYRTEAVNKMIDQWVNQEFLGKECTYGDDRHMTTLLLSNLYKIYYTHQAKCYSETPETYIRFFNQQTRWTKSSYREVFFIFRALIDLSFFLTIDIMYQVFYGIFLLGALIYIFFFGNFIQLGIYMSILAGQNILKALIPIIVEKNYDFVMYFMYSLSYVFVIAPAKIYALLTITDKGWGTSPRLTKINKYKDYIFPFIWFSFILSGIIINIYRNRYSFISDYNYIFVVCVFGLYIIGYILFKIIQRIKQ